ncbi:glycosyltransferase [Clostridium boliviensis]|uniref:Glycosyltransferase n=1 Tax=Clostridium boliviensis TaxID=318465 RepID=A0ABU4GJW7_9CLOT|nr:glycosyltransferase [Clostridium boliviensis]MDW2797287.1 glycosyltransferase [Clostridium boliviensis]
MIFATVGTHEQPFNRLLEEIDRLKETGIILEDVIIQTGYSSYEPRHCEWHKLLPYDDMVKNVERAHIVITHGGPASFIMPLQIGKIPVVVPRQYEFHEHVNDHQVEFTKAVKERYGNIIPVYDILELADVIVNYDSMITSIPAGIMSNNGAFNKQIELLVKGLFRKDQETDRWQK